MGNGEKVETTTTTNSTRRDSERAIETQQGRRRAKASLNSLPS